MLTACVSFVAGLLPGVGKATGELICDDRSGDRPATAHRLDGSGRRRPRALRIARPPPARAARTERSGSALPCSRRTRARRRGRTRRANHRRRRRARRANAAQGARRAARTRAQHHRVRRDRHAAGEAGAGRNARVTCAYPRRGRRSVPQRAHRGGGPCRLPLVTVPEKDVAAATAHALGITPSSLQRHVAEIGHIAGAPWRADQKLATMAAMLSFVRTAADAAR